MKRQRIKDDTRIFRKKRKRGDLASMSLIIALLDRLADAVYRVITQSCLFGFLTAYSREQCAFENNGIKKLWHRQTKLRTSLRRLRYWISNSLDNSFITGACRRLCRLLLSLPLNAYGNFLLAFGLYTVLVYFVGWIIPNYQTADAGHLILGIALCIVSLPLLFSKASLAAAIRRGKLTRMLFVNTFDFRDDSFTQGNKKNARGNLLIIIGMLCGLLTLLVSPFIILQVIFILIGLSLVFVKPEVGVVFSVFALPFLSFADHPTVILALLVLSTFFAYLFKLLRGKRVFKLEILDASILLFGILILFSGIFSAGGLSSFREALTAISLLLGYFLIVNLMRTPKWIKRCVVAITSSAIVVALVGIFEYLFGNLNVSWLDQTYFSDIKGRVVSLFENSNVLGAYLVITFPFVVLLLIRQANPRIKNLLLLGCVSLILCNIFTWSRGAWLAMLISTAFFLLIYSKKTFRLFFALSICLPFLPMVLPDNIVKRFLSIGDLADSSTSYRFYTWRGTLSAIKEHFWGGIGYGTDAYGAVYPSYAYAGMESAEHSHNLFLQILLAMGICGLIIFCLAILLSVQQSNEFISCSKDPDAKLTVTACLSSLVAALIMGTVDYIWFNYRVFFLFWIVLALASAYIRSQKEEISRKQNLNVSSDPASASVDVTL